MVGYYHMTHLCDCLKPPFTLSLFDVGLLCIAIAASITEVQWGFIIVTPMMAAEVVAAPNQLSV